MPTYTPWGAAAPEVQPWVAGAPPIHEGHAHRGGRPHSKAQGSWTSLPHLSKAAEAWNGGPSIPCPQEGPAPAFPHPACPTSSTGSARVWPPTSVVGGRPAQARAEVVGGQGAALRALPAQAAVTQGGRVQSRPFSTMDRAGPPLAETPRPVDSRPSRTMGRWAPPSLAEASARLPG